MVYNTIIPIGFNELSIGHEDFRYITDVGLPTDKPNLILFSGSLTIGF